MTWPLSSLQFSGGSFSVFVLLGTWDVSRTLRYGSWVPLRYLSIVASAFAISDRAMFIFPRPDAFHVWTHLVQSERGEEEGVMQSFARWLIAQNKRFGFPFDQDWEIIERKVRDLVERASSDKLNNPDKFVDQVEHVRLLAVLLVNLRRTTLAGYIDKDKTAYLKHDKARHVLKCSEHLSIDNRAVKPIITLLGQAQTTGEMDKVFNPHDFVIRGFLSTSSRGGSKLVATLKEGVPIAFQREARNEVSGFSGGWSGSQGCCK